MSDIGFFFNPKSFAVIGASDNPKKGGNIVIRNLQEFGYRGTIYPINPKGGVIADLPAYPSLGDVPDEVELAMIVIPRDRVPTAVRECGEKGVRGVIISTAGFSDSGEKMGRDLENEVRGIADRYGMRIMGPNSIGTINATDGFVTSITSLLRPENAGAVSFFGQTGMFASGFFRWITSSQHFAVSKVACLGNKNDVDETDILAYLGDDPETSVVGVYFEGVSRGREFLETIRDVSRKKPVVVLKSGRTERGARAVSSHTGTLAGEDGVYDGVFQSTGAVRVDDFDHFYDCLKAFSFVPLPRGRRLGVISITGVGCVLTADYTDLYGLEIPSLSDEGIARMREVFPEWAKVSNPVDMWFAIENVGPRRAYEVITEALIQEKQVDVLLVIFTLIPESDFDAGEIFADIKKKHPDTPILACFMAGELSQYTRWREEFERRRIPVFPGPGRAVFAAAALVRYAEFLSSDR